MTRIFIEAGLPGRGVPCGLHFFCKRFAHFWLGPTLAPPRALAVLRMDAKLPTDERVSLPCRALALQPITPRSSFRRAK